MDLILYGIVGIVCVYLLFKIFAFLKKKGLFKINKKDKENKKEKKIKKKKEKAVENVTGNVTLTDKYMYRREMKALVALNRVLPKEYIALPKVSGANLFEPVGTRNLYNVVKEYFMDFVIFEEATMKPKLVVDIYDNSFEDELLKQRHPQLITILKNLNLEVLEIAVRGEIDLVALKNLLDKKLGIFNVNETK